MRVVKDEHKIKEGELFGQKGFIITESKELRFKVEEIKYKQPLKISNTRRVEKVGDEYIIHEEAEYFNDPIVFMEVVKNLSMNEEAIKKGLEDAKKSSAKQLKKIRLLIKEYSKYEKRCKELLSEEG